MICVGLSAAFWPAYRTNLAVLKIFLLIMPVCIQVSYPIKNFQYFVMSFDDFSHRVNFWATLRRQNVMAKITAAQYSV